MRRAHRQPRVARVFAFATTSMAALSASALAFAASAPVPDAAEDIRDIRAPWAIPPWWRWPLAIAAAAVAALAIVLLVRWWHKRRARAQTPLERARESLRLAEAHARAGRSREWADIVSETLRGALAARLGASVLPQTTSELADAARTVLSTRVRSRRPARPRRRPLPKGACPRRRRSSSCSVPATSRDSQRRASTRRPSSRALSSRAISSSDSSRLGPPRRRPLHLDTSW
jgi:hypothetical protein